MSLSRYITVNITNATPRVSQAGFGTILIFGDAPFADRVKTYTLNGSTLSSMISDDSFTTASATYQAMAAIVGLGSDRSITQVKVGRRDNPVTQTFDLTPVKTTEDYVYKIKVAGTEYTYTVQSGDAVADITAGLETAMSGSSGWTATDNSTKLTIAADAAGTWYPIEVTSIDGTGPAASGSASIIVEDVSTDANANADMQTIMDADDDFYCVVIPNSAEATVDGLEAGAALSGSNRLIAYNTMNTEVKDSGTSDDVASGLESAADISPEVFGFWHHNGGDMPHAAAAAHILSYNPGEPTWAQKFLRGVTAVPRKHLKETEKTVLDGKSINYYVDEAGNGGWTQTGLGRSQDFIDIARGTHWTIARIQEAIATIKLSLPKIPFTDAGIALVTGAVEDVLRQGAQNGLYVLSSINVEAPAAADVSAANKAARTLPSVTFSATFQGAIHSVTINGTVTA